VLTQRIVRFLNDQSKTDSEKFTEFYEDYKLYFKEAIARSSDQNEKVSESGICLDFRLHQAKSLTN
jgi:TNF receptor-associated protein 1